VSTIRPKRISDFKPLFGSLAQTSHYQVIFGGLPAPLTNYLIRRGVTLPFISENAGLLCFNASLPTASFATKDVDGNFTGIKEKFAAARMYEEISLDFYVDSNYQQLKFLESWMEFIASGSHNPLESSLPSVNQAESNYFVRMQYPENYKCSFTRILKFDRDYNQEIEYRFIGLWPYAMTPPQISYTSSEILKVTATFKFDRYIAGRALSIDTFFGTDNNKTGDQNDSTITSTDSQRRLTPIRGNSGVVFYDANLDTRTSAEVNGRFFDSQGRPILN
jgi:hypothetical protein